MLEYTKHKANPTVACDLQNLKTNSLVELPDMTRWESHAENTCEYAQFDPHSC